MEGFSCPQCKNLVITLNIQLILISFVIIAQKKRISVLNVRNFSITDELSFNHGEKMIISNLLKFKLFKFVVIMELTETVITKGTLETFMKQKNLKNLITIKSESLKRI